MTYDLEKMASDWIAYACYARNEAPDQIIADGMALYDLVDDDPASAWMAIRIVVGRYKEEDYYSFEETDAQKVVGLLAAGPLEDLLGAQGAVFINAIELEARKDCRMAWALGGVWQFTMTDDLWKRVQQVADHSYWERDVSQ